MIFTGERARTELFELVATAIFLPQHFVGNLIYIDMGTGNNCWYAAAQDGQAGEGCVHVFNVFFHILSNLDQRAAMIYSLELPLMQDKRTNISAESPRF